MEIEEQLVQQQADGTEIPPGVEEAPHQDATPLEGSPS